MFYNPQFGEKEWQIQNVMKVTSEKLLIIYGKTPAARWDRMKNSGLWLLNKFLPANAPAQNAHLQRNHLHLLAQSRRLPKNQLQRSNLNEIQSGCQAFEFGSFFFV